MSVSRRESSALTKAASRMTSPAPKLPVVAAGILTNHSTVQLTSPKQATPSPPNHTSRLLNHSGPSLQHTDEIGEYIHCTIVTMVARAITMCTIVTMVARAIAMCTIVTMVARAIAMCTIVTMVARAITMCTIVTMVARAITMCTIVTMVARAITMCTIVTMVARAITMCTIVTMVVLPGLEDLPLFLRNMVESVNVHTGWCEQMMSASYPLRISSKVNDNLQRQKSILEDQTKFVQEQIQLYRVSRLL